MKCAQRARLQDEQELACEVPVIHFLLCFILQLPIVVRWLEEDVAAADSRACEISKLSCTRGCNWSHLHKVSAYGDQGDLETAQLWYDKALRPGPSSPVSHDPGQTRSSTARRIHFQQSSAPYRGPTIQPPAPELETSEAARVNKTNKIIDTSLAKAHVKVRCPAASAFRV